MAQCAGVALKHVWWGREHVGKHEAQGGLQHLERVPDFRQVGDVSIFVFFGFGHGVGEDGELPDWFGSECSFVNRSNKLWGVRYLTVLGRLQVALEACIELFELFERRPGDIHEMRHEEEELADMHALDSTV